MKNHIIILLLVGMIIVFLVLYPLQSNPGTMMKPKVIKISHGGNNAAVPVIVIDSGRAVSNGIAPAIKSLYGNITITISNDGEVICL